MNHQNVSAPLVAAADPLDGFDAFWDAFPVKRDKPKARIAWRNAIKKAAPSVIVAAAVAYRDDPNRDAKFTKWPQGWLNGERWNDAPMEAPEPVDSWAAYR